MRSMIGAAIGALTLAGVTMAAQSPAPTQPPSTPRAPTATQPAGPAVKTDKAVTMTGCLKSAEAAMGRSATRTTAPPAEAPGREAETSQQFVLTNVEGGEHSGESAGAPKSYVLSADATVNLAAHVNHKVSVTGKVTPAGSGIKPPPPHTSSEAPPGTPSQGASDMASKMVPTLAVTTLKMVSTTCS